MASPEPLYNFVKRSTPKVTSFAFWIDPNDQSKGMMATNDDAYHCGGVKANFKVSRIDTSRPSADHPGVDWAVRLKEIRVSVGDEAAAALLLGWKTVGNTYFKFSTSRSGIYFSDELWRHVEPVFDDAGVPTIAKKHFVMNCDELRAKTLPTFTFKLKSKTNGEKTFTITPDEYVLPFPGIPDNCAVYIAPTGKPDHYSIFGYIFMKQFPTQFIFDPREKGKKHKVAISEEVETC